MKMASTQVTSCLLRERDVPPDAKSAREVQSKEFAAGHVRHGRRNYEVRLWSRLGEFPMLPQEVFREKC